jgi:acetyl-CoA acetyltransferase
MPEAEQGLNVGRLISLMGLNIVDVPGVTVNRYCASGLETIGMATAKIQSGMADCIIAGGAESMSLSRWAVTNQHPIIRWPKTARRLLLGHGIHRRSRRQTIQRLARGSG